MPESQYDVAIIGAGFSGPILAANIAEKGVHPATRDRLKIALIEAGPYLKGAPRPGYGIPLRRQRFTNMRGQDPAFHWEDGGAKIVGGKFTALASLGISSLSHRLRPLARGNRSGLD